MSAVAGPGVCEHFRSLQQPQAGMSILPFANDKTGAPGGDVPHVSMAAPRVARAGVLGRGQGPSQGLPEAGESASGRSCGVSPCRETVPRGQEPPGLDV